MLQNSFRKDLEPQYSSCESAAELVNLERLIAAARRQLFMVVLGGILGLGVGLAYVITVIPLFTSSISILLSPDDSAFSVRNIPELSLRDERAIFTQIEVLRSENLASRVVDLLSLTSNPIFMAEDKSLLARLSGILLGIPRRFVSSHESEPSDPEPARKRKAIAILVSRLSVDRVGKSDLLLASYRSNDRVQAAQIAQAYGTAYQQYQEALQKQSFPVTRARILAEASTPDFPSHPRTFLVLAIASIAGIAGGAGFGTLREFRDRSFRTGDEIKRELSLEILGVVPKINYPPGKIRAPQHADPMLGFAAEHPLSTFAEGIRGARVVADADLANIPSKVIGITSVLPAEGKTIVAANLARLVAGQGVPTLLIDADLRKPELTKSLAPDAGESFVDVIVNGRPLNEVLLWDQSRRLAFLPGALERRLCSTSEILASGGMASVLSDAKEAFDYVILDLPPIAPVVDVRAFSPQVDGLVLVVEWGTTFRRLVRSILQSEPQVRSKCLGVVLNKVDIRRMKLYGADESKEYYADRLAAYYVEQ